MLYIFVNIFYGRKEIVELTTRKFLTQAKFIFDIKVEIKSRLASPTWLCIFAPDLIFMLDSLDLDCISYVSCVI